MGDGTAVDSAQADVALACAALRRLQTIDYWQIPELDLLAFASLVEGVARLSYAAQVRVAGEVHTRNTSALFGSSAPASLLLETLTISAADAKARLAAASMILPQIQPSGVKTDPVMPELAVAMNAGSIGTEQVRTIVATINHARNADPGMLDQAKKVLVETGQLLAPKPFADFAKAIAHTLDVDGKPDKDPADRVELTIGTRNPDTGLTRFRGQLDDVGAELLGKALEGLTKTNPDQDGATDLDGALDRRSPAVRGQAFKEILTRYLNVGDTPTHGGERPHITLTMDYSDLRDRIGAAYLELGGVIGAGEVRLLACDADIIPMVMGSKSEVLDVGRGKRLFPAPIRKAITQRDRGCCFPGCVTGHPPGQTPITF